jgi:hypothetical protein
LTIGEKRRAGAQRVNAEPHRHVHRESVTSRWLSF